MGRKKLRQRLYYSASTWYPRVLYECVSKYARASINILGKLRTQNVSLRLIWTSFSVFFVVVVVVVFFYALVSTQIRCSLKVLVGDSAFELVPFSTCSSSDKHSKSTRLRILFVTQIPIDAQFLLLDPTPHILSTFHQQSLIMMRSQVRSFSDWSRSLCASRPPNFTIIFYTTNIHPTLTRKLWIPHQPQPSITHKNLILVNRHSYRSVGFRQSSFYEERPQKK